MNYLVQISSFLLFSHFAIYQEKIHPMKRNYLLAVLILFLVSCQKDDETFVPQCTVATNLSVNNITFNSASLAWDDPNGSGSNGIATYNIEYGLSGFPQGSGTNAFSSTTTLTLNNLLPNTSYDYYIQTICSTNNPSVFSEVKSFTTLAPFVVRDFMPTLSQMNLFQGNLSGLAPTPYSFEYALNSQLYTDYALKQRFIVLPTGETMRYVNDALPDFPNNTVVVKTFYYNNDDRDISLGKQIIETRVMIKKNGVWEFGDYVWNASQTEASLDPDGATLPVTYIDASGTAQSINYKIPSQENCFTCHQSNSQPTLIGPKLRSMNFDINGSNQLQKFIAEGHLVNAPAPSSIGVLPNWEDQSLSDEVRSRAYMDVNCAHCHSAGGFHNVNYFDALNLNFETSFEDSHLYAQRESIIPRILTSIEAYSMPYIGVTTPHTEAVDLIVAYLESLD